MSTTDSTSTTNNNSTQRKFIKRPDDKVLKQELESLKNEIKKLDLQNNDLNDQIAKHQIDQKIMDERNELTTQLKSLISKQSASKNERNAINEQIKSIDNTMKKKIAEIQQQASKNNFKSVGEIDQRINSLDQLIDAGNLKLADERRYVKEMTSLRKLKKDFASIEKVQLSIDSDKQKIADLKKKISGTQNKELNTQFETIQKKLDEINESNKTIISKRQKLYDQRSEIKKQKDAKYDEIRKLKSDFDAKFANFKKLMAEEKLKRDEEYKSKLLEEKQSKLKAIAEKELAEASIPAFSKEINSIHNVLSYFDPSYVKPTTKTSSTTTTNGVVPSTTRKARTIEFPEDLVVVKKEQEDFFGGSKKKGGKFNKKAQPQTTKSKNFSVAPEIVVALSDLTIPFPLKEEDVPQTITTLKETLVALEEKQDEQTKINIERAKAQIAKLEAEGLKDDDEEEEEEDVEEVKEEVEADA
ncbi:BFR1 [Candida pseudojiufengensis]|uniref:BFR1 n=1 Tax=Candida pseudojiufengensis TaxID=497109 RepID=UPI002224A2E7|nr:BFR1 [Candida pseudojiufengensis]KAI5965674.1 BFR1 [Candida pseudojiufengensis]